ncbi:MAG: nucleotidyltransferase domain-containing protein [Bacteroidia bacterium]
MELSKQDIITFILEKKESFSDQFNIEKIGLFGSFAEGKATEESDIDLMVDFKEGTKGLFEKKSAIKDLFESKFNRKIDIAGSKYLKPHFREYILKQTIYV